MRKTITTFCLSLLMVFSAWAQQSTSTRLVGVLESEDTRQPIVGAKLTLGNQRISTTTNQQGKFTFSFLEAGDEELIIEAVGYITDVEIVNLRENEENNIGKIALQSDVQGEMADEVILQLSDMELNDDEGKSQSMASGSNASTDVFNKNTGYAWSSVRYRQRGFEQQYEHTYINGLEFNSAERGTFNYGMVGGLNDASRNKDEVNGIEANGFSYGDLGKTTNIQMDATRYAQGWKVGLSGANRNYKGRVYATYASGVLQNGWAFVGSLA